MKGTLVGNLPRDVEVRTTPNGTEVANFSVPDNVWHGGQSHTVWYNCSVWNPSDFVKNLKKGSGVFVVGDYFPRPYTTKDGVEKISHDMRVLDVSFLPGRRQAETATDGAGGDDDDQPF